MDVNIVNVFSIKNQGGNPCAIVDNANNLTSEEMQAKATRLNFPETIFIIQNKDQYILRFFATKNELPLCCHGILGAAFYLFKSRNTSAIYVSLWDRVNTLAFRRTL